MVHQYLSLKAFLNKPKTDMNHGCLTFSYCELSKGKTFEFIKKLQKLIELKFYLDVDDSVKLIVPCCVCYMKLHYLHLVLTN